MNMFKGTEAATPKEYFKSLDEPRRSHVKQIHDFIRRIVPNLKPYMQAGMLAYGSHHYRYASGREGDWMIIGLSGRKNYISVYICAAMEDGQYLPESYKERLPAADIGKSCVRFKSPDDIDLDVLAELIREGARILEPGRIPQV
jgi:hypothetical protein